MTYTEIRDRIQQSHANDGDEILDRLLEVLEYAGGIESRLNKLTTATGSATAYNHISLRHRDAREFTNDVTELLNEGWEFAAPFVVAAGAIGGDDLWMAFLRRPALTLTAASAPTSDDGPPDGLIEDLCSLEDRT